MGSWIADVAAALDARDKRREADRRAYLATPEGQAAAAEALRADGAPMSAENSTYAVVQCPTHGRQEA